jgi:hypothetical protein
MGTLSLGNIKEDYKLKTRIKNHATKTLRN